MKCKQTILIGIICIFLQISKADKILVVLPIASKSHVNVFEPLVRALGERGHEVVNLSPIISPKMPLNVRQIQIYKVEEIFGEMGNPFEMRKMGKFQALINGSFDSLKDSCARLLKTDKFQDLVLNEKFDLIIVDILMNYCVLGIVALLEAPSIMVSTFAAPSILSDDLGNRLPPSFVPDPFLSFTHKMSFPQRLMNVVLGGAMAFIWDNFFIKSSEQLYRDNLPHGSSLPGVHEIQANSSMIFMNSHFTLNYPRPLLPDVIEVGGMHTRPAKPLPQDLAEFFDGSGNDGVIFFSLGSIVPAKVMPEEYRRIFINVFSRLKQRVLWKWETETMPDIPPNVMLRKWLPQQDILGHPKVKLFMTHGGLLSTQEAAYHGVPLFGIPIFGDQDLNVKQAEFAGYAKFFEILDITEEKLEKALSEILNDSSYMQKAKQLSKIVRDLPQTPLDKAVYWTEYVLRHKGAPHLRSAARDLNFFQYYVIDVVLVLTAVAAMSLLLVYLMIKAVFRRFCGGQRPKSKKLKVK